jgi:carboxylesterase type B
MLSLTLLLSTLLLPKDALTSTTGPTVNVGYATYLGNQSYPNTVAYLGVPYAEPPVGDLRFRETVPLNTARLRKEAGGQVVNATYYPDFCVQGGTGGESPWSTHDVLRRSPVITLGGDAGGAGSEDCLKVNIYTPYGAKEGDNCKCGLQIARCDLMRHCHEVPVLFYIHGGGKIIRR